LELLLQPDTAATRQYHCFADAMETPTQQTALRAQATFRGEEGENGKKSQGWHRKKMQHIQGAQSLF